MVEIEKNTNISTSIKSCWDCIYQQIAGETFLGTCTWFSKHKAQKNKEIRPDIVDVGCKYFVKREK